MDNSDRCSRRHFEVSSWRAWLRWAWCDYNCRCSAVVDLWTPVHYLRSNLCKKTDDDCSNPLKKDYKFLNNFYDGYNLEPFQYLGLYGKTAPEDKGNKGH